MKKWCVLFVLLVACAQPVEEPVKTVEVPVETPVQVPIPVIHDTDDYIITGLKTFISSNATPDKFNIVPAIRYDGVYNVNGVRAIAHVFRFSTRTELEYVLSTDFKEIINHGSLNYDGHNIAHYLSIADNRIAVWTRGTELIYLETHNPESIALDVFEAYLDKYPSDLDTGLCRDTDGSNHFFRGQATRVLIGNDIVPFTDVCLRDYAPYKNGQFTSQKGLREEDGLLEGRCQRHATWPGYIEEHVCPRGCRDGACLA